MISEFEKFGGSSFVYGGSYLPAKPPRFPPFEEPLAGNFYNEDTNSSLTIYDKFIFSERDRQKRSKRALFHKSTPILSKDTTMTMREALVPVVKNKPNNFAK